MSDSRWLTVQQLADQISVSYESIKKWHQRGRIKQDCCRYVDGLGQGGKQLEIDPEGIPEKYRSEYFCSIAQETGDTHRVEIDNSLYDRLKDYQKEHVDLWLTLFDKYGDLKGSDLEAALDAFAAEHPEVSCSYKTFMRKKKEYHQAGIAGLAPGWGKREGDSKIDDEDFALFKSTYLKESRPTLSSCWEIVRGAAWKAGRDVSDFPHPKSFQRRLENEMPAPAIYLARYGQHEYNKKYGYYIDRDKSDIQSGSVWVSDHRQLDIFVTNQKGKAYRPWLTAWMDFKSGKWISWFLHECPPNSDHIFQTFKWGIEEFGMPEHIYIDNGKDYRSNDFAGGRVIDNERESRSMILRLGIQPHFALPYNAQAKNIERAFQNFIQFMEQHFPGYAGKNAQERPEETTELIKKGQIMDEDAFNELFGRFVTQKLNRKPSQGREHQGLSANELFFKEKNLKRAPRPEALRMLCMRTSGTRMIGRNGVKDSETGRKYYTELMEEHKGKKVYLRRDLKNYLVAYVFDAATGDFLYEAPLSEAADGLAHDPVSRQQIRDLNRRKRRTKKMHQAYLNELESPDPKDIVEYMIANEDATEQLRRASGDFQAYDERLKVSIIEDTPADQIIEKQKERKRQLNQKLDDIDPGERKKPARKLTFWEGEEIKKTSTG